MRRFIKWSIVALFVGGVGFGFYALKVWDRAWFLTDLKERAVSFTSGIYHRLENVFIDREKTTPPKEKKIIWCANECFWLDDEGRAFESALRTEGGLVPLVIESSNRALKLKSEVIDKKQIGYLLEIVDFLKMAGINFDHIEVGDLSGEDAWVDVEEGPTIYFSLRFSPMFGLGVVKSLKASEEWKKIEYIDLRAENRVFYKFI